MPINAPERINLSTASDSYFKYAEKKFRYLEAARIEAGLEVLKKTIPLGGSVLAHLVSTTLGGKIILLGGSANILFSSGESVGLFSWEESSLAVVSDNIGTDWLTHGAPDTIYTSSGDTVKALDSYGTKESIINTEPIAYYKNKQISIWDNNNVLSTVYNEEVVNLSRMDILGNRSLDFPIINNGPFVSFPMTGIGNNWNLFDTTHLFSYAPESGVAMDADYWVPSVFYAAAADRDYAPGFHYGNYGRYGWEEYGKNGNIQASRSTIDVLFGGYMSVKGKNIKNISGYCEFCVKLDDTNEFIFSLFSGTSFPNRTCGYEAYTHENAKMAGSLPQGFSRELGLDFSYFFTGTYDENTILKTDLWAFDSFSGEIKASNTPEPEAKGLVIVDGKQALGVRIKGGYNTLFETYNYHSHSVSHDGEILALFEGGEVITKVTVWNLFGPGVELLSELDIGENKFTVGEIIPFTIDDKPDKSFLEDFVQKDITQTSDPSDWYSPYAYIYCSEKGLTSVSIEKLEITNGRFGFISRSVDLCGRGNLTEYHASTYTSQVSFKVDGYNYSGEMQGVSGSVPKILFYAGGNGVPFHVVFSSFTGTGDNILIDNPASGGGEIYEYPRTLGAGANSDVGVTYSESTGILIASNTIGEVTFGGCATQKGNAWYLDGECVNSAFENCNDASITATTSCGQSGSGKVAWPEPYPPIVISCGGIAIGDNIGECSLSCGEVNSDGLVTSLDGCCGTITKTCEISCEPQTVGCRAPNGTWVLQSSTFPTTNFPSYGIYQTIISGGTKTVNLLQSSGSEYADPYAYGSSCITWQDGVPSGYGSGYVNAGTICGNMPNAPNVNTLPGTISAFSSLDVSPWYLQNWGGNFVQTYGWALFDVKYTQIYTWECP